MNSTARLSLGIGLVCALAATGCPPRTPPPPVDSGSPGVDSSVPPGCGNGTADGTEQCDGADLGGATCVSIAQGYTGGTLGCTAVCSFDTSGCTSAGGCGNLTLDAGEECDGTNLGGMSCASFYLPGGTLGCSGGCTIDRSGCTGPDLMVYAGALTIDMGIINSYDLSPDEVALGCGPSGTTNRRVMEFTLVSENVGTAELHFGSPSTTSSWPAPYTGLWAVNAAGYRAFHDYATYWLCAGTDQTACASPTAVHAAEGFKESFCFIENFGIAPDYSGPPAAPACNTVYGCGDMGQRPGCADDYYPGLDCQWIDITGLASGSYVLCAHIDPTDRIYELRDDNNIGCTTVTIP